MDLGKPSTKRMMDGETALKIAALAICALVLLRHAWICDDAFITFRTARNLILGEGLRWNLHERVQGFTHPLWALLLIPVYALAKEPMGAAFALSLAASMATLYLVAFRLRLPTPCALLVVAILISSKSFVDYSSSGLENPLTHLLLVLLVAEHVAALDRGTQGADRVVASRRTALRATLLSGLLALNRLDAVLFALPFLLSAYAGLRDSVRGAARILLLGFLPFLIWEIFAVVYYGFPFPNTAYAKLASGVPRAALWLQGAHYYLSQADFDPISVVAMAFALLLVALRRDRYAFVLGAGLLLYLIYVTGIGGDFMAGRFFSAPTLVAALAIGLLLRGPVASTGRVAYLPALTTLGLGLCLTAHPTLGSSTDYPLAVNPVSKNYWDERGVCDERAYYAPSSGLMRSSRTSVMPNDWRTARGLSVPENGVVSLAQVGVAGFFAPPTAIIVDGYGLNDAFVARLPTADKVSWRIGHFVRALPTGYMETLQYRRNVIADPKLAQLYDRIQVVVSGPIWAWERWKEVLRLNLGMSPPPLPPAPPVKRRLIPTIRPAPPAAKKPGQGVPNR